jgi:integrase
MTVSALLDQWLADLEDAVSRRTWENRETLGRVHIKPNIGAVKLTILAENDLRGFYRRLTAGGLSPSSVKRIHSLLNQAMRYAVRRRYVTYNLVADVKPPTEQQQEKEVLSPQQVKQLLNAARGDRYEGIFVLGATCGLRVGECLALRFEDLDLDKGTIKIRHTLWKGSTYEPKTERSKRTLKLPKIAYDVLRRHVERTETQAGWLFPSKNNTPLAASNFWRWGWKPMLKKAGLPTTFTYHQLRHGAASFLLNQNVPVPVVSRFLGHANPGVTMRVYAHMIDGTESMTADGMDAALG